MQALLKKMAALAVLFTILLVPQTFSEDPKKEERKPLEIKTPQASTASAPSVNKGWFVGIRAACVPAIMAEIGYQFNEAFKLRVLGGGFRHYFRNYEVDGQKYDHIRFKILMAGLMADWHLFKGGLRVTGGVAYNGNRIQLTHTATGILLGHPANIYGTITAHYRFRPVSPYLGIGYDSGLLGKTRLSLSADAGFWFQGKARSRVTLTGLGKDSQELKDGVKAHTEKLLNKNRLVRFLPMISVGIRYAF